MGDIWLRNFSIHADHQVSSMDNQLEINLRIRQWVAFWQRTAHASPTWVIGVATRLGGYSQPADHLAESPLSAQTGCFLPEGLRPRRRARKVQRVQAASKLTRRRVTVSVANPIMSHRSGGIAKEHGQLRVKGRVRCVHPYPTRYSTNYFALINRSLRCTLIS